MWTDLIWLRMGPVVGFEKTAMEHQSFLKVEEFLE
jgi:hypothetical protein